MSSKFKDVKIGPLTQKVLNEGVYTCEHNHPGGSLFDAVDNVDNYIKAAVAAGYKNFAVTDHASFSAMQTAIDAAAEINKKAGENTINIIYGVEAYIEVPPFTIKEKTGHLIMLAVNERGKHIVDKLISNAGQKRNGKPVISFDELNSVQFNGDVIATSACISGPCAIQLLANDIFKNQVQKEMQILEKEDTDEDGNTVKYCISPDDEYYLSQKEAVEIAKKKLNECISIRDSTVLKEELKTLRANVRTLKKKGEDYSKDEKKIKEIQEKQKQAKENAGKLKNVFNEENKKLKELQVKVDKYLLHKEKSNEYLSAMKSDEILYAAATETAIFYDKLFGKGNFFLEIQYHGFENEKEVYTKLCKIAEENDIPLVAANDAHIADNTKRSIDMRNVARYLRFTTVSETEADNELYIKNPYELAQALSAVYPDVAVAESLSNLNVIGDRCKYMPKKVNHYPVFKKGIDANALLREEAIKGIDWRYPNGTGWDEERQKRMEYELNVIIQMGYADYHLIVKDFLEYARIIGKIPVDKLKEVPLTIEGAKKYVQEHGYDIGIGIGIGRGSGAGSLVTYLLGITGIDPFKYNLIFERFLNPERISMPDIDSDFALGVREKTIEYVRSKYGESAVVGILTEGREQAKGAIRDAARYLGKKLYDDDSVFLAKGTAMRKSVPAETTNFKDLVNSENKTLYEFLKSEFAGDKDALNILEIALHCEGMLTSYGQHAAGVIIYDEDDITDYIPVRNGNLDMRVTEMDMIQCEVDGLLKMDFLGLKTLSIVTDAVRMIEADTGEKIDVENIPLEGNKADKVYRNIYAKGKTRNVFQFESSGMQNYLKQLFS